VDTWIAVQIDLNAGMPLLIRPGTFKEKIKPFPTLEYGHFDADGLLSLSIRCVRPKGDKE
jgi:hypothetical protein